jgi:4-amino-4-deoxy-L-arabinose transferase-like glycosyltransferase
MLQAWIVVPVFAVVYLIGSPSSSRRRLLDLLSFGGVLLASSLWWVALVSAWPDPKPYIGGSTDGSVLNLVVGYNGLGRIFGRELVGGSGAPGGPPVAPWGMGAGGGRGDRGGGFGGGSGFTRLFGEQVGGQISWLLPLCLLVLVAVGIVGIQRARSGLAADPARRAGWVLWGGWLLLVGLVLSFAQGGFHPYYTTEMAPAVAAVTAAGLAAMWRSYRWPGGYRWLLLPAAVTLTVSWAWVLVSRDLSWNGWLRYAVAGVGAVAVILLVTGRLSFTGRSAGISQLAGVLAVVALLVAPGVWSAATAFGSRGGVLAQAGPPSSAFGRGRFGQLRGELPAGFHRAMAGELTADQSKILAYVQDNSDGRPITLAVEGGAMAAEAYIIHSDAAVVGMGGFFGQDPAPTVDALTHWVQQGQLRFVLAGRASPGGLSTQRTQWVQQRCAAVRPDAYGGSAPARSNLAGPFDRADVLYDCQTRTS